MTNRAWSINGIPIRLSDERWRHIVEHHDDLAGHFHDVLETVAAPEAVYDGVMPASCSRSPRYAYHVSWWSCIVKLRLTTAS